MNPSTLFDGVHQTSRKRLSRGTTCNHPLCCLGWPPHVPSSNLSVSVPLSRPSARGDRNLTLYFSLRIILLPVFYNLSFISWTSGPLLAEEFADWLRDQQNSRRPWPFRLWGLFIQASIDYISQYSRGEVDLHLLGIGFLYLIRENHRSLLVNWGDPVLCCSQRGIRAPPGGVLWSGQC